MKSQWEQLATWRSSHLDGAIVAIGDGLRLEVGLQLSVKVLVEEGRHGIHAVGENLVQKPGSAAQEIPVEQSAPLLRPLGLDTLCANLG